jgi:hypothetical protein
VIAFPPQRQEAPVLDVVYLLGTILFFALMLVFVRGCAALGRGAGGAAAGRTAAREEP